MFDIQMLKVKMIFVFVAKRFNRLPKYDPCETDYISLAEKFANLEARMGSLEDHVIWSKASDSDIACYQSLTF